MTVIFSIIRAGRKRTRIFLSLFNMVKDNMDKSSEINSHKLKGVIDGCTVSVISKKFSVLNGFVIFSDLGKDVDFGFHLLFDFPR